jgi:hypothetical protein
VAAPRWKNIFRHHWWAAGPWALPHGRGSEEERTPHGRGSEWKAGEPISLGGADFSLVLDDRDPAFSTYAQLRDVREGRAIGAAKSFCADNLAVFGLEHETALNLADCCNPLAFAEFVKSLLVIHPESQVDSPAVVQ